MNEPTNEQKIKRLGKIMRMLQEKQKTAPANIKNLTNELAKVPTAYSAKTFIHQMDLAKKAAIYQGELRIVEALLKFPEDGKGEMTFDDLNVSLKSFSDQISAEHNRCMALLEGVNEPSIHSSDAEQSFWINSLCEISRARGSMDFIEKIVMIMANKHINLYV